MARNPDQHQKKSRDNTRKHKGHQKVAFVLMYFTCTLCQSVSGCIWLLTTGQKRSACHMNLE